MLLQPKQTNKILDYILSYLEQYLIIIHTNLLLTILTTQLFNGAPSQYSQQTWVETVCRMYQGIIPIAAHSVSYLTQRWLNPHTWWSNLQEQRSGVWPLYTTRSFRCQQSHRINFINIKFWEPLLPTKKVLNYNKENYSREGYAQHKLERRTKRTIITSYSRLHQSNHSGSSWQMDPPPKPSLQTSTENHCGWIKKYSAELGKKLCLDPILTLKMCNTTSTTFLLILWGKYERNSTTTLQKTLVLTIKHSGTTVIVVPQHKLTSPT